MAGKRPLPLQCGEDALYLKYLAIAFDGRAYGVFSEHFFLTSLHVASLSLIALTINSVTFYPKKT